MKNLCSLTLLAASALVSSCAGSGEVRRTRTPEVAHACEARAQKGSAAADNIDRPACAPGEDCVRLPFIPFKQDGGATSVVRVWRSAGQLPRERACPGTAPDPEPRKSPE